MYSDGYKIKEIVDYLNEHNIRTYRNGEMTINIVQRMLSNRRYIGEYKFQKTVVPNGIPAIISEELFNRIQEILAKNKRSPARKKAEDEYLLTLKLFCGECGAHMVGESGMGTSKVYRYYKCYNTKKVHTCDKKPVRKEWIEDLAVKAALDILRNNEIIDYLTDKIYALQGEENPRIPKLKAQLADVEKRLANIMQAIEQGIIFDTTKERFAELEKEKKELEITILQEKIRKPFLTKEQIRFGIEKFGKLDISTKEGKQRLIDGFINAIYVYDDKITFAFNYKDGTRTVMLSELSDGKNNSDLKCQGAPRSYHPNCWLVTSEWFGFIFYLKQTTATRLAMQQSPFRRFAPYGFTLYIGKSEEIKYNKKRLKTARISIKKLRKRFNRARSSSIFVPVTEEYKTDLLPVLFFAFRCGGNDAVSIS